MAALRLLDPVSGGLYRFGNSVRRWQLWTLSAALRLYLLTTMSAAVAMTVLAAVSTTWRARDALLYIALLVCGLVAVETTRGVREAHGEVVRDMQSVWFLAIAITLPPAYAFLAPMLLIAHKLWRVRGLVIHRRIFSSATLSIAYGSASQVFHAIPRSVAGYTPGTASHALAWTVNVAACGLMGWLINHLMIVAAIKLSDRQVRVRDLIGSRESITSDLLELSLAVCITLVVAINPVFMALALPSVVLCRRSIMRAQLVANARIDAKTGLLNAATWQREALAEFASALRSRSPLALAIVNIDHFKDINQMAGQDVRDQLLRDVAEMLKEQLPDQDLIGRFSSEEFAILLPQTGPGEAKRISERLRDHVAGEPIAIESGSQAGYVFRLTVSIGVAVLNESRRALAELIGAADSALSQATRTGWNKVCVLSDGSGGIDESQGRLDTW